MALPFSLEAALEKLGHETVLAGYLGKETLAFYGETKRLEHKRFLKIISPAEYAWYL